MPDLCDVDPQERPAHSGSDFGRCPVCEKPLRPRCRLTGEPRVPPAGSGYESRARCDGCGTVIYYCGEGEWRVLAHADLTEDDRFADQMGF